jgi:hypothetical protein
MSLVFATDPTGFPIVHLLDLGIEAQLWPVARTQFAACIAHCPSLKPAFEAARALPISSTKNRPPLDLYARLMTGMIPEDLVAFTAWINMMQEAAGAPPLYAIPTINQWRTIHDTLQYERCEPHVEVLQASCSSPSAHDFLQLVLEKRQPQTMLELSLMREGLIEWGKGVDRWTGLGQPAWDFYPNTFEPMRETIDPIDTTRRQRTFGFRLIRRF